MSFDNLQDIISWCKDNAKPPKGYDILDIKIRNQGDGFKVTIAFQLKSDIIAPLVVQMYDVNSFGKIVEFKEAAVENWVK